MALAEPVASTIAALRALHPPDDHALHPDSPTPPPLCDYAPNDPPLEHLSRTHFHEVWFRKLPKLSAADHAGWRYEYLSSTKSSLPIGSSPPRAPMPLLVLLLPSSPAEAQTLFSTSRPTSLKATFRLRSALGSSEDASLPFPNQEIPKPIGSSGPSPSARPLAELSRWLRLGNSRIDSRPTFSHPRLAHPTHPPSLMARPGLPKSASLAAQALSSPRTPCELSSTRTRRG